MERVVASSGRDVLGVGARGRGHQAPTTEAFVGHALGCCRAARRGAEGRPALLDGGAVWFPGSDGSALPRSAVTQGLIDFSFSSPPSLCQPFLPLPTCFLSSPLCVRISSDSSVMPGRELFFYANVPEFHSSKRLFSWESTLIPPTLPKPQFFFF